MFNLKCFSQMLKIHGGMQLNSKIPLFIFIFLTIGSFLFCKNPDDKDLLSLIYSMPFGLIISLLCGISFIYSLVDKINHDILNVFSLFGNYFLIYLILITNYFLVNLFLIAIDVVIFVFIVNIYFSGGFNL